MVKHSIGKILMMMTLFVVLSLGTLFEYTAVPLLNVLSHLAWAVLGNLMLTSFTTFRKYNKDNNKERNLSKRFNLRKFQVSTDVPRLLTLVGDAMDLNKEQFMKNLELKRPPGPVGNKPKKKELKIKAMKQEMITSDQIIEVPFMTERPRVNVNIKNLIDVEGLIDTGATSCLISTRVANKLRENIQLVRVENDYTVTGVLNQTSKIEVVLLDITIENQISLKNVPFAVCDSESDIILGMNVISHCKISSRFDETGKIQIGFTNKTNKFTAFKTTFSEVNNLRCASVCDLHIEPGNCFMIEMKIDKAQGLKNTNLNNMNVSVTSILPKQAAGYEFLESIDRIKNGRFKAVIKSTSDLPLLIPEGTEIAKIFESKEQPKKTGLDIREYLQIRRHFLGLPTKTIKTCYCKEVTIQFCDQYGYNPYYTRQEIPYDEIRNIQPLVYIENKKIFLSENFDATTDIELKNEDIELLKQFKDQEVYILPDRNLNAKHLRLLECIGEILPNLIKLKGPFNDHEGCLKDIPFDLGTKPKNVTLIFTNGNKMEKQDVKCNFKDIPWLSASSNENQKEIKIIVHICESATKFEVNKRIINVLRMIYYSIPTKELKIEMDIANPSQIKEGIEIARELLPKKIIDTRAIFHGIMVLKDKNKETYINSSCDCKKEYKDEEHKTLYNGSKQNLPHANLKISMVKIKDQIENGEGISNSLELVMENHGDYYEQKWDEVGLVPYPRTPEPPTEKEKLVSREWRDYIKVDEFPENVRETFEKICEENKSVFAYVPSDVKFVLEDGKTAEFDLDLSHDTPIWSKSFPIYGHMLEKLEKKIDQLLEHGLIEEIESPYNTNIFLVAHNSSNKHVKPEDREYRLVMDFRGLNAITRFSNRYSFMVKGVEAELSRLRGAKVFSLIDCEKSYRSCKASEKTKRICAFVVPNSTKYATKQFSFSSVSDGLASIPGYYSNLLQKTLSETSRKHTICHIDDICVFSNSVEEHVEHLKMVLEDLRKSNFMIAARKVEFFKKRIKLLGHYISENTISIDQDRKTRISNMSPPKSRKEILQFLGVINYLFSFLDSIQLIAMPLYDALKGNASLSKITLNEIQLKAFEEIKLLVDKAQDLAIIDYSQPLHMEVDSSYVGCGSCVFQMRTDDKGKQHKDLIRFTSKRYTMQQAVCYSSLEKESLSLLFSIQQNFNLLINSVEGIIATDMKSLLSMLSCYSSTSNQQLSRISYFLYSLHFKWRLNHLS